jgi:protein SCO1/2
VGDDMKHRYWLFFLLIGILMLSACGKKEIENGVDYPVADFTATDQQGESFEKKELDGKIWIADFIFTNCADVCIPMTANMAKLQKLVKEEDLKNVEFVSFSVDPDIDIPEKLTEYINLYELDTKNWNFLTGYSQEFIEEYAMDTFKTIVKKPEEGDQVIHQTYIYLIAPDGHIKKIYSGLSDMPEEEIIGDIKSLQ